MTTDSVKEALDQAEEVDLPELADLDEVAHAADSGHDGEFDRDVLSFTAGLPLNDYGNGQRFVAHFGRDVIHVPRVGWFVWNGRVWARDPDEMEVRRRAQKIAAVIEAEAAHLSLPPRQAEMLARRKPLQDEREALERARMVGTLSDDDAARLARIDAELAEIAAIAKRLASARKQHVAFARTSGNSTRISNAYAEASPALSRALEDLDADPLVINTENCALRFVVDEDPDEGMSRSARVERIEHDRGLLLTKSMAASYDPDAKAPLFEAFLTRIQPDAEMRAFLQRWFGYSMTALTGEQKLVFLYGAGANGKSVLVDLIARVLGDYSATAKIESLIGRNRRSGAEATPDLIPLVGARFVRASEPEEGERLQEAKIKELTGGEPIMVRNLNSDFFEMQPLFKLTISGNHKPDIRGTDDGIWRRLLLVPFDVQIPPAERDQHLGRKLFQERAGILNWLIEGLLDYLENGLQEPEAVTQATREYREDSDPVGTFLAECTVVTGIETDFVKAKDLIEAFNFWLEERGEARWGNRTVSTRIKEKSARWRHPGTGKAFIPGKNVTTGYRGIRFTDLFAGRFDGRSSGGGGSYAEEFPG